MKTRIGAPARIFTCTTLVLTCTALVLAGGAARGDSIIAPAGLPDSGIFYTWQVPCLYEFGPVGPDCGGDYETLQNYVSSNAFDPATGKSAGFLTATSVTGADFHRKSQRIRRAGPVARLDFLLFG